MSSKATQVDEPMGKEAGPENVGRASLTVDADFPTKGRATDNDNGPQTLSTVGTEQTSPWSSSTPGNAEAPSPTTSSSRGSAAAAAVQTPLAIQGNISLNETTENQPIRAWTSLCIFPGTLVDFEDAEKAMEDDGIKKMGFYKNGSQEVKRGVHYIYGIEYKKEETPSVRIEAIKLLVDEPSGNLQRLVDAAFSTATDTAYTDDAGIDGYLQMALTQRHFFSQKNVFGGGFGGGRPVSRFQKSRNCYWAATCLWFSMVIRHFKEYYENVSADYVVDIPQRIRYHIFKHEALLEKRVISNLGHDSSNFACELVGDSPHEKWEFLDMTHVHRSVENLCKMNCKDLGCGLVFNFRIETEFRNAHQEAKTKEQGTLGYWKFDGSSSDDAAATFVEVDRTAELDAYEVELRRVVEEQRKQAEKDQESTKNKLFEYFKFHEGVSDTSVVGQDALSVEEAVTAEEVPAEGQSAEQPRAYHAMTMLGGITIYFPAPKKDGKFMKKQYFLLLNSWKAMPLVLVSADYLKYCEAKILFRTTPPPHRQYSTSVSLVSDCATPLPGTDAGGQESHLLDAIETFGFDQEKKEVREDDE